MEEQHQKASKYIEVLESQLKAAVLKKKLDAIEAKRPSDNPSSSSDLQKVVNRHFNNGFDFDDHSSLGHLVNEFEERINEDNLKQLLDPLPTNSPAPESVEVPVDLHG